MEKNKLEISGKTGPETVSASYKPIPEQDVEDQALSRPKTLVKVSACSEVDGADEKMLPADDKVPEVVVFDKDTKSPQNGDAKLDIAEAKQAFVGLTKEELMKYANDPFWIRLRWFLFVTFWLLWASMLIGAILIIYAAPKCDPPPPRTWYQQGPLTEVSDKATLESLDKNIQGVVIPWTEDVYEPLKNNPVGLALLETANKLGTKVIIELDSTVSNVWFEKSERKDPEFDGYYIWKQGKIQGGSTSAPNNWLSPNNVSSWKYSDIRREYYYSPFSKPHLNFRNSSVIKEFNKVIEIFLALNVSGIRLRNAAFLLVDPNFDNEEANGNVYPGLTLDQYRFYKHSKTENLQELGDLLKGWRALIRNKTETGPLMVAEQLAKVDSYKVNDSLVVDMPLQSHIFSKPVLSVNETAYSLNYTLNIEGIEWPLWKARTDALPKDVLDIITYLLPGAPLVNSSESVNPVLIKIRESPSIMRGFCGVYSLQNNTILAFIRVTPGSPGILVAVNPTERAEIANIPKEIPLLSNLQEVTVRYYSNNYNNSDFKDLGGKRTALAVPISPKSAIVLEYVPKRDE
ncbi:amino acid transporter heavy chain SLC3A1 isoform X1 [Euwallacea fornicatus]|uniref:amino acid transporter heavy chain SLC3A1 isoform X1 n=1 Tax=Euwallacea fornicatus TaxID=995702 RepID=UPI00339036C3